MNSGTIAFLAAFIGIASIVPAIMAARDAAPAYRAWYGGAVAGILAGLACAFLGIFIGSGNDVLFWLGVLLVAAGVLTVWSLKLRTWQMISKAGGRP